jgi:hypothetical protein
MNLFNEKMNINNKTNSPKNSFTAIRTCTSCCPYDAKNVPHPQLNYFSANQIDTNVNEITSNSNACCLSKLRVDCRVQCHKKKNKRYDSIHSSRSTKRSIASSSSLLSPHRKRKKFGSSTNTNSHNYDFDTQTSSSLSLSTSESEVSQQSFSSNESEKQYRHYNKSASTIFE